ncbi:NAD(P)-binding domain, Fatty acyl-CoA reductase [Artemisia annua]|uniref:Fatty acyl-CoA reductase n=1 Tax=Artemisia annua TaxID=35608 RepID=A0A2U1L4L3_ARTAN|nr:NAD(P)-binding domain, Fatty acyl-CoA reductase [Artemisia annua]
MHVVFVEKILRVQPHVKKLYLLVRANDAESALQRFYTEVVSKDLFNVLKEKHGANLQSFLAEKVTLVAGDITRENMGVQDYSLCEQMWRDVDVVVNVAASTNFKERYDVALALNTYGAKIVLDFARKCANIKLLLHVSTAYVSGEKPGLILETPYHLGDTPDGVKGLDIKQEKRIIEDKLNMFKFDHKTNDKIITLAMKDLGTRRGGDTLIAGYGKGGFKCFLGDPEVVHDAVPADMVVNAMLATIVAHANQTSFETIYHVGSSVSNPLKFDTVQKCAYLYFSQNPWTDNNGKLVTVKKLTVLKSMASFNKYIALRYLLPLQLLKVVNIICCQAFNGTYKNFERKINLVQRVVKLNKPYLLSKSLFEDTNTENLRNVVQRSENDVNVFFFDPRRIDWEDYILHTHIPGLVKYEF